MFEWNALQSVEIILIIFLSQSVVSAQLWTSWLGWSRPEPFNRHVKEKPKKVLFSVEKDGYAMLRPCCPCLIIMKDGHFEYEHFFFSDRSLINKKIIAMLETVWSCYRAAIWQQSL